MRDITERRREEDQVNATLREKEALLVEKESLLAEKESLLKEIHHRVKNNLQVTSSLLRLQSEYIQDEHARGLFAESQNRIRSMALVHEKLYRSNDLSKINFCEYTESLAQLLFRSYGTNTCLIKFRMKGSTGPVFLSIENAIPCGLIINELLSNCLKHAFPNKNAGEIWIEIEDRTDNRTTLTVSDNGIGLPKGFDLEKTETLGLQIVHTLAKQLSGRIEVHSNGGTTFKITIPSNNSPASPSIPVTPGKGTTDE